MTKIIAQSKYLDLSKSIKLYYVLAIGIFISIISYLVYLNLIVTITMAVSTLAAYIILSQPKEDISIDIALDGLIIGENILKWDSSIGWSVVSLNGVLEFIIQTPDLTSDFIYFYLREDLPEAKIMIQILSDNIPYDLEIAEKNVVHNFLRNWGLK